MTQRETAIESAAPIIRFVAFFGIGYLLLHWLASGSGPLPAVNTAIQELTVVQTMAAEQLLRLVGEPVRRDGDLLMGAAFSCEVGEGCNGMSALNLVLAGILSFPALPRRKLAGLLLLVPAVFAINIFRIAGLYWTGVHHPSFFNMAHVYVGQVLVIIVTVVLWWFWIAWNSRPLVASSPASS
jgi:exosortase/archaeosortase family protein